MTPTIFFVRHGETDWNAEGRLQGQTEIALNARGEAQARAAGRILAGLAGARDARFVSSPMRRTQRTMVLAREAMGLDPHAFDTDPRLIELTFGRWEGLIWPEVSAREPQLSRQREADKWNFRPPGGESYADLVARIQPWIDDLDGPVVAVSHGGVARALMHRLGSLAPERAAMGDIHQGRVLLFEAGRFRWIG